MLNKHKTMAKLNYETKAEFQAALFSPTLKSLLEGGNLVGTATRIDYTMAQILKGLSDVWDAAE
jgi:hypothetical protein